jgi:prephenate dehydrogenase
MFPAQCELAAMRDDMRVLTAIMLRNEETLIRMLEQMQAITRVMDRLCATEDSHDAWRELNRLEETR